MSDIATRDCPGCPSKMLQVIGRKETDDGYELVRKGWYCKDCRQFVEAILRERKVTSADI